MNIFILCTHIAEKVGLLIVAILKAVFYYNIGKVLTQWLVQ